jgi:hypothetical protein
VQNARVNMPGRESEDDSCFLVRAPDLFPIAGSECLSKFKTLIAWQRRLVLSREMAGSSVTTFQR